MATEKRVAALRERLDGLEADAFLVTSRINRMYLSGFSGSAGWLLLSRARAYALIDFRYREQVKQQAPSFEPVEGDDFAESLAKLVKEEGLGRVAFEAAHTSVKDQNRREEMLPQVRWVPTSGVIEEIRAVKEPEELARIERAVALADEAFTYITGRLAGRSEKEVALDLEFFLRRNGAQALAFPSIVASGPQGALPHAVPTDRVIGRGDLVTLDFGAYLDGYCSDMTRTVGIGPLTARQREVYDVVLRAQRAGLEAVRPGRLGKEVDADARAVIEAAGFGKNFGHGLGHGVGMEVQEDPPRLSRRGEARLVPGMVTSVEPGIYIAGWGGVRIEDLVVVTEEGCRVLTRSPKELLEL